MKEKEKFVLSEIQAWASVLRTRTVGTRGQPRMAGGRPGGGGVRGGGALGCSGHGCSTRVSVAVCCSFWLFCLVHLIFSLFLLNFVGV